MDGVTYILVFGQQALYFGHRLQHSLVCPNQVWDCNSNKVKDILQRYDSSSTHGITLCSDDTASSIPLQVDGVISYFDLRKPTKKELVNCEHVLATDTQEEDATNASFLHVVAALSGSRPACGTAVNFTSTIHPKPIGTGYDTQRLLHLESICTNQIQGTTILQQTDLASIVDNGDLLFIYQRRLDWRHPDILSQLEEHNKVINTKIGDEVKPSDTDLENELGKPPLGLFNGKYEGEDEVLMAEPEASSQDVDDLTNKDLDEYLGSEVLFQIGDKCNRKGHLNKLFHLFAYLKNYSKLKLVFDASVPEEELLPQDMPDPSGIPVVTSCFVDVDHVGCKATRRLHKGIIIFVNRVPSISWFSKRQTTVETSIFGSEIVVLRIAIEMTTLDAMFPNSTPKTGRHDNQNGETPLPVLAQLASTMMHSDSEDHHNHDHDYDHDPTLLYRDEELALDGRNSDKEGNQARGFDLLYELIGEKEDGMPCILREVYCLKDGIAINYAKALAIAVAYDIYIKCTEGKLVPEWGMKKPMTAHQFQARLAEQIIWYHPLNDFFWGDTALQKHTQQTFLARATRDTIKSRTDQTRSFPVEVEDGKQMNYLSLKTITHAMKNS
eukprot:jgi/Psemu1/3716/gm1.3716_g